MFYDPKVNYLGLVGYIDLFTAKFPTEGAYLVVGTMSLASPCRDSRDSRRHSRTCQMCRQDIQYGDSCLSVCGERDQEAGAGVGGEVTGSLQLATPN